MGLDEVSEELVNVSDAVAPSLTHQAPSEEDAQTSL